MADNSKDFIKEYKKLEKVSESARGLGRHRNNPQGFEVATQEFVEVFRNNYKVDNSLVDLWMSLNPQVRFEVIQLDIEKRGVEITKYGMRNLDTILDDVDDSGIKDTALSIVPIRDIDIKDMDRLDLDEVMQDYKEKAEKLDTTLGDMNTTLRNMGPVTKANRDKYEDLERKISSVKESKEEYEKYRTIINDNKDLVKQIASYRQLTYNLVSKDGRPDGEKLRESINKYLDKIKAKYANDEKKLRANVSLIEAIREVSKNDRHLVEFYDKAIIKPAETKINKFFAEGNYDLKDYIKKTSDAMDTNKKTDFVRGIYELTSNDADYANLVFINSGLINRRREE